MATILRAPPAARPAEIVSDPEILGGWPVVSGTRIPAETIVAFIKDGASDRDIVRSYPTMPLDGIVAVRRWASAAGLL